MRAWPGCDGTAQPRGRAFGTSPAALPTLADWGIDPGLQTGARASPGVDGLPRCEEWEARGLRDCGMRAPSIQRGPGRQRDVLDGPWLLTLQRDRCLAASLRSAAACVALRPRLPIVAPRLEHRAPHGLHLPQAL
jgi:hypothetical protein